MKCKADTSRGPCTNAAKPGSSYCRQHTRDANLATAYRLSDPSLKETVAYHAKGSLLDISQQIVLMRGMIERRLNMAEDDPASHIAAYNFVASQLVNLTKMTEIMIKLSRESGDLMDRASVEAYVDAVMAIVTDEIKALPDFEPVIDRIVTRIEEIETDE